MLVSTPCGLCHRLQSNSFSDSQDLGKLPTFETFPQSGHTSATPLLPYINDPRHQLEHQQSAESPQRNVSQESSPHLPPPIYHQGEHPTSTPRTAIGSEEASQRSSMNEETMEDRIRVVTDLFMEEKRKNLPQNEQEKAPPLVENETNQRLEELRLDRLRRLDNPPVQRPPPPPVQALSRQTQGLTRPTSGFDSSGWPTEPASGYANPIYESYGPTYPQSAIPWGRGTYPSSEQSVRKHTIRGMTDLM